MSDHTTDPMAEITAMQKLAEALFGLDTEATARVLRWAADRFKVASVLRSGSEPAEQKEATFQDFASLYDSANPSTDAEKALVGGYWFQVIQGQQDLDAQQINAGLKNLGHGIGNITAAFNDLINRTPRLVIQTRKSGTAKQARKKYRLTVEGTRKVKEMLNAKPEQEE